jgi:hypothetical protein
MTRNIKDFPEHVVEAAKSWGKDKDNRYLNMIFVEGDHCYTTNGHVLLTGKAPAGLEDGAFDIRGNVAVKNVTFWNIPKLSVVNDRFNDDMRDSCTVDTKDWDKTVNDILRIIDKDRGINYKEYSFKKNHGKFIVKCGRDCISFHHTIDNYRKVLHMLMIVR